jgi:Ca-activated chloride channel family protein
VSNFLYNYFGIPSGAYYFASPALLALILLVLPLIPWAPVQKFFRGFKKSAPRGASWPSIIPVSNALKKLAGSPKYKVKSWLKHIPTYCRALALVLLAIAAARPQGGPVKAKQTNEGLDIILAIDTSRSMEARDFVLNGERPTRLEVIKDVISTFIGSRPADRIGLVVFGTAAFTQAPLTLDHEVLQRFVKRIKIGMAGDATAIGDGLGTAVNRLKDIEAKSKVVILLTDGSNTAGRLDPIAAAEAAKALGIKVYCVGVGSDGEVPIVIDGRLTRQRVEIDEDSLKQIATITGGVYFRATDTETLVKIYKTIDKLEKTKIQRDDMEDRDEHFRAFAGPALALLLLEALWGLTRFRRIPS